MEGAPEPIQEWQSMLEMDERLALIGDKLDRERAVALLKHHEFEILSFADFRRVTEAMDVLNEDYLWGELYELVTDIGFDLKEALREFLRDGVSISPNYLGEVFPSDGEGSFLMQTERSQLEADVAQMQRLLKFSELTGIEEWNSRE